MVYDGYLYAAYATNKEDVQFTRVPVSSLYKPTVSLAYVYKQASTDLWTTTGNWTPQALPSPIDTAIIRTGEAKLAADFAGYIKVEPNGIFRSTSFINLSTIELLGGAIKVNSSNQSAGMKANILVKEASSVIAGSNVITLFTLNGTITGSANLSKKDLGIVKVKADASTFKGLWIVEQDTLTIASASGLGQGGAIVNAAGVLDIDIAASTNSLTVNDKGKLNLDAALTVATTVFGGVNIPAGTYTATDYPTVISGSGSLTVLSCPACVTTKSQTIQLQKGWNLISINVHPSDSTIVTLFIGLDVQEVKNMDAFWHKGQTDVFNSLKTITSGEGYLVNMSAAGTLRVAGTQNLQGFKNLEGLGSGWHLIGCPYQSAYPISPDYDETNCSAIKNFEGFWIPNGTANSLQNFEVGKGYFIKK